MKKRYLAPLRWVVVAMLLALIPQAARACSCVVPGPPAEALAQASAVFAGKVIDVRYSWSTGSSADPVYVIFNVSSVWKGTAFRIQQVQTAFSGASCGKGFYLDREYIVYGYEVEDHLEVSLCSRTQFLEDAEEDLAAFGAGADPIRKNSYIPTLLHHDPPCEKSLVGTLERNSGFNTFLQALDAANLTSALESAGPYTIFAPTDAAFDNLPAGVLDQLLANPTGQLTQILLFHIVPGRLEYRDLENGMVLTTQQGKTVTVERGVDCYTRINGARILTPDLQASNGIIHAIDTVILPPPD